MGRAAPFPATSQSLPPRIQLHVTELPKGEEVEYWQYWCQLSFRSTDLHVGRAWSLANERDLGELNVTAQKLQGPVVYSFLNAEDLLGGVDGIRTALQKGEFHIDWQRVELPVGTIISPTSSNGQKGHLYMICRVALGRTAVTKPGADVDFGKFVSSCLVHAISHKPLDNPTASSMSATAVLDESGGVAGADWQHVYRVRAGEQVLPVLLCEVIFERQTSTQGPSLLCDMCNSRAAVVYCRNDNAHFCAACDAAHHTENEFFARHQRFPMQHSPLQFGFCPQHQPDRYETVCLQCKRMLCKVCNKSGSHSGPDTAGHALLSTIEAFRDAMQGSNDSDRASEARRSALREVLYEGHVQLTEVQASFEDVQQQLDVVLRGLLDQLAKAQSRKVEFLQSTKRQLLSQMLFVQWLENFLAHCKLTLPPADFLAALRRHDDLLVALFGLAEAQGETKALESIVGPIPQWIDEQLVVEGALTVRATSGAATSTGSPEKASGLPEVAPLHNRKAAPPDGTGGTGDTLYMKTGIRGFEGYINQAFQYLEKVEQHDGARDAPPSGVPPPPRVANLQLAMEVLVQLRLGCEEAPGLSKPWGCMLALLWACPSLERGELLVRILQVALPIGNAAMELAMALVKDDVGRVQLPSLIASANNLDAALAQALLRLLGDGCRVLDAELAGLVQDVEQLPATAEASSGMHGAVARFFRGLTSSIRLGGEPCFPPCIVDHCHFLYAAAEVKFSVLAAQNAVVTLLISCVVTPSLLRIAQRSSQGLSERTSDLSRLLQRISHFAHYDDNGEDGQMLRVGDAPGDLREVLEHVGALRELVAKVLMLPVEQGLGLHASADETETSATWLVQSCQRWAAGTVGAAGQSRGRQQRMPEQLAAASRGIARLGDVAEMAALRDALMERS